MKINILILCLLILGVAGWTYFSNQENPPTGIAITDENLEKAPEFTYSTIAGIKGKLSDHQGKIVFIHFWASWCAPCLVEFPELMALARQFPEKLAIIAITLDENINDIEKFLTSADKTLPKNVYVIQDKQEKLAKDLYKIGKLPETYIISGDSVVLEKITGPQKSWNNAVWQRKISAGYSE